MTYYDEKLSTLREQVEKKAHYDAVLKSLNEKKKELDAKVLKFENSRDKSQATLKHLEKFNLVSLFYKIIGKKENKIAEARKQLDSDNENLKLTTRELSDVNESISVYKDKSRQFAGCEENYKRILAEKTNALIDVGCADSEEISRLDNLISFYENQKPKINEAIRVGKNSKIIANNAISMLKKADSAATWDLFGGGEFAAISKHDALKKAQNAINDLHVQLIDFKTELVGVTINANIDVRINDFLRLIDYFHDTTYVNSMVLYQIGESKSHVQKIIDNIENALSKLSSMLSTINEDQDKAQKKLNYLTLKAEFNDVPNISNILKHDAKKLFTEYSINSSIIYFVRAKKIESATQLVLGIWDKCDKVQFAEHLHNMINSVVFNIYSLRNDSKEMRNFLHFICDLSISNIENYAKGAIRNPDGLCYMSVLEKKAILLEKEGRIEEAISVCDIGIKYQVLDGGYKREKYGSFEERKKHLLNVLYKQT